jgi:hypothetical protein
MSSKIYVEVRELRREKEAELLANSLAVGISNEKKGLFSW